MLTSTSERGGRTGDGIVGEYSGAGSSDLIVAATKTGRLLVVHESPLTGGFGGEVAASVTESDAFDFLEAPIRRLAGLETPIPYNPELEKGVVPQEEDIVKAAVEIMAG